MVDIEIGPAVVAVSVEDILVSVCGMEVIMGSEEETIEMVDGVPAEVNTLYEMKFMCSS